VDRAEVGSLPKLVAPVEPLHLALVIIVISVSVAVLALAIAGLDVNDDGAFGGACSKDNWVRIKVCGCCAVAKVPHGVTKHPLPPCPLP
jgi:hypothetical protein